MEHDDPEKRIADLERMQGWASASRPAEPPPSNSPAPQSGWQESPGGLERRAAARWQQRRLPWESEAGRSGDGPPHAPGAGLPAMSRPVSRRPARGKFGIAGLVLTLILVLVWSFEALHALYGYTVGTPTTVTSCVQQYKGGIKCNGSWTIDGQIHSGQVLGGRHPGEVDVHARDRTAYTKDSVSIRLVFVPAVIVIAALVAFFLHRSDQRGDSKSPKRRRLR
jgi:hypothetical protein